MKKLRVLFVCSGPGVRALIAEAYLNKLAGDTLEGVSAQFEARMGYVPEFVHKLMAEEDIQISGEFPPTVFDRHQNDEPYDYVVTLCHASTQVVCPIFRSNVKVLYRQDAEKLSWSIPDFRSLSGLTGEERVTAARLIRKLIRLEVEKLIEHAIARTHETQLA